MDEKHINQEEDIHTEQMQEIIGKPPMWLYRWGITLILSVVAICISISSFISYPDVIKTSLKVYSSHPPDVVSYKDSIRIDKILVENGQAVKKGQNLADINDSTDHYNFSIKAAADGKIFYAGIIYENEQMLPKQPIFYLSVNNREFFGEIIILGKDSYKVKPGQTVLITFPNVSNKQYALRGVIKYIINNPLKNEEYIAKVDFENFNKNTDNRFFLLNGGVIANAEIITENETLFNRLIKGLLRKV